MDGGSTTAGMAMVIEHFYYYYTNYTTLADYTPAVINQMLNYTVCNIPASTD